MKRYALSILVVAISITGLFVAGSASAATPQVAAGGFHTCALEYDGTVKCFGFNQYGELGNTTNNGNSNPNPTPTTVDLGGEAKQVTAGESYTCALLTDGTVKCFGYNGEGQLGNATNNGNSNPNPTPTTVDLGGEAKQIAAGGLHTCALLTDGTVKCFGSNRNGQLGNTTNSGTTNPNPTPTTVDLGGEAKQIAAGGYHTCALLTDGTLKCFGRNLFGQLGNTTNSGNDNPNPTPTTVDLGGEAKQATAGEFHSCALLIDGAVKCFGYNYYGQLGNTTNNSIPNPTPTTVDLGGEAKQATAGGYHTCALLTDGALKCFGFNQRGQLGNTTNSGTLNPNPTPTTVDLGGEAKQATAGGSHTCALLTDGTLKCFGFNYYGQLGNTTNNETYNPNPTPTTVAGLDLSVPPTPPPTPVAPAPTPAPTVTVATFVKPSWKIRRSGNKLKLTTTAKLVGDGVNATTCKGTVLFSARPRHTGGGQGRPGSGKPKKAPPTFALRYENGTCFVTISHTLPARYARRGVEVKMIFTLVESTTLVAPARSSKPKLR